MTGPAQPVHSFDGRFRGTRLIAHTRHGMIVRANEVRLAQLATFGKVRVFRKETDTWMEAVGTCHARDPPERCSR